MSPGHIQGYVQMSLLSRMIPITTPTHYPLLWSTACGIKDYRQQPLAVNQDEALVTCKGCRRWLAAWHGSPTSDATRSAA